MKNYSVEIFVEQLILINFSNHSNYTCVNDAYKEFVTRFLTVINFVALFETVTSTIKK